MIDLLSQHLRAIVSLCERHRVRRLDVFGSAATGEFDPARSDVDFVVEFLPQERRGLSDVYFLLAEDLEKLLGRPIDLVEVTAIRNPIFRESVESTRVPLYDAA